MLLCMYYSRVHSLSFKFQISLSDDGQPFISMNYVLQRNVLCLIHRMFLNVVVIISTVLRCSIISLIQYIPKRICFFLGIYGSKLYMWDSNS